MNRKIRFLSILMAAMLLAADCLPVLAAKSPGGNTDFPDNPFDIVIPTRPDTPARKRKRNTSEATQNDAANAQQADPAATGRGIGPAGAGAVTPDPNVGPNPDVTGKDAYSGDSRIDFVVKTTRYANGIIEASLTKPLDGLKYKLIVTPYAQYPTVADEESRAMFPVAYADVTGAPVLSDYLTIIRPKAEEAGVAPESCYAYAMYDMSYYRDYGDHFEKSELYDSISISLPDYVLDRFVCLLHYTGEKWEVVENARVLKETGMLRFTVTELSPFAIVVHDAGAAAGPVVKSPQTGYDFVTEMFLAAKEWLTGLFDKQ